MNSGIETTSCRLKVEWPLAACMACALVTALGGCGETDHGAQVTGAVTLNGELLSRGTVAFHPLEGGAIAYGEIQSDGSFSLRTGKGNLSDIDVGSLATGEYIATVVAHAPVRQGIGESGGPPDPGQLLTPIKYASKATSNLRRTVEPGSGNNFVLALEFDEPPAEPDDGSTTEEGTEESIDSESAASASADTSNEVNQDESDEPAETVEPAEDEAESVPQF